jgi:hypothetical protein
MGKTLAQLEAALATRTADLNSYNSSLQSLGKTLSTVQSGLLDFRDIGESAYFKQTGAQKLATKEVPRYTDVYDKEYSAIKDVQFTLGGDAATASNTDNAFYVFNAAKTAERNTEQQIGEVEKNNLAYQKQQEDIAKFLNSEKQTAQTGVLQKYLSSVLNPVVPKGGINPFQHDTVDLNTASGLARWNAAKRSNKISTTIYDPVTRRTIPIYYVKLSESESAAKRELTREIETTRFMSSADLQKTWANYYADELKKSIADFTKKQTDTTNRIADITKKIAAKK